MEAGCEAAGTRASPGGVAVPTLTGRLRGFDCKNSLSSNINIQIHVHVQKTMVLVGCRWNRGWVDIGGGWV